MSIFRKAANKLGAARTRNLLAALGVIVVFALLAAILFREGPRRSLDPARPAGACPQTPWPQYSPGPGPIEWVHY